MNLEEIRFYCLSLPNVTEDFPFDETILAFRIGGKIFCLANIEKGNTINLKCDPEWAIELRENFDGIVPGYHMNKKHWNTVYIDRDVSHEKIKELIDHSYQQIFKSLTKKIQHELSN